eukprot:35852-Chlamydomonas_euryale.AAC.1
MQQFCKVLTPQPCPYLPLSTPSPTPSPAAGVATTPGRCYGIQSFHTIHPVDAPSAPLCSPLPSFPYPVAGTAGPHRLVAAGAVASRASFAALLWLLGFDHPIVGRQQRPVSGHRNAGGGAGSVGGHRTRPHPRG